MSGNVSIPPRITVELSAVYIIAACELLKTAADAYVKLDEKSYSFIQSHIKTIIVDIEPTQSWLTESDTSIGRIILQDERILPKDYPVQVLHLLPDWVDQVKATVFCLEENFFTSQPDVIEKRNRECKRLIHKLFELIDVLPEISAKRSILDVFTSQSSKIENTQSHRSELLSSQRIGSSLYASFPYDETDEKLSQLIAYKIGFIYFKQLMTLKLNELTPEVTDAYESVISGMNKNLEAVLDDELWLLGNHYIQPMLERIGVFSSLQKREIVVEHIQVLEVRKGILTLTSDEGLVHRTRCMMELKQQVALCKRLLESGPQLMAIYNHLNKCLLELLHLHEYYDVSELVQIGAIGDSQSLKVWMDYAGFRQTEFMQGDMYNVDECQIIAYLPTQEPEMDHLIVSVHSQGLIHHSKTLSRCKVTVYRFSLEN